MAAGCLGGLLTLVGVGLWGVGVEAVTRDYYIAAEEMVWDYAPSGGDLINDPQFHQESHQATFLEQGPQRIGRRYKKALYRGYTDNTFTTPTPREEWLGYLGPIVRGEVGDILKIHFYNKATRNYTVHTHGVIYSKDSEGVPYQDGTSGADKADDAVPPGGRHTYTWNVTSQGSPSPEDPDCLSWLYHSHVDALKDTNTGLVGFVLTCKPGVLSRRPRPREREVALLLTVLDENQSWLLEDNIRTYCSDHATLDREDPDFMESNMMHAMNGYLYGNLPGLRSCAYDTITWYLSGFGNEVDLHTLTVSGHSFLMNDNRQASVSMNTVEFSVATMKTNNPGTWLVSCQVNDHINAGMQALLQVDRCGQYRQNWRWRPSFRRYYITAEEVNWDYGLGGRDLFSGGSLTDPGKSSEIFFRRGNGFIGGVYTKALFREYTDITFRERKQRSRDEEHLGFLGPVIRAEVGDIIKIQFWNKASRAYSMHAHGVEFSKFSEGRLYNDSQPRSSKGDDVVWPGRIKTYYWTVSDNMAPGPRDPPCVTRMYTSAVDVVKDTYSGLVGPMVICRRGALDTSTSREVGVNKEFFLLFSVTDENQSWYLQRNIQNAGITDANTEDEDFIESNLMHGINGRLYGTLGGLDMCLGDHVTWHVMSVGTEVDVHTVEFSGQPVSLVHSHRVAAVVLPGQYQTLNMTAVNPGTWSVVCRTNDHFNAGTKALMEVINCDQRPLPVDLSGGDNPVVFYIQAEEIEWDYAPSGLDIVEGGNLSQAEHPGHVFTAREGMKLGSRYRKAVYRQYLDPAFTQPAPRHPTLGLLGPLLRLQVGETVRVVFRNNASRHYSLHAQGVLYRKSSEGAAYGHVRPGESGDDSVAPGATYTYTWVVPPSSGPGPSDGNCTNYMYYSAVDPVKDTLSGLIGPLVVCRPGVLTSSRVRNDVTTDLPLFFGVLDENQSWYLDHNIATYSLQPQSVDQANEEFIESNMMHAINGYLFGALDPPTMRIDDVVDWYLMSLGTEIDLHSVHFHGNRVTKYGGGRRHDDVAQLYPGIALHVVMVPEAAGTWMVHCHVNDHMHGGMIALYRVFEKISFPTPS